MPPPPTLFGAARRQPACAGRGAGRPSSKVDSIVSHVSVPLLSHDVFRGRRPYFPRAAPRGPSIATPLRCIRTITFARCARARGSAIHCGGGPVEKRQVGWCFFEGKYGFKRMMPQPQFRPYYKAAIPVLLTTPSDFCDDRVL